MNFYEVYRPDENTPSEVYTLEVGRLGLYTVRCGDRYQDMLGADEALYLMARIILTDGTVNLRSLDEHKAEHARNYGPASILEPWQKQVCARGNISEWQRIKVSNACYLCGCAGYVLNFRRTKGLIPTTKIYCDKCSPVVVL